MEYGDLGLKPEIIPGSLPGMPYLEQMPIRDLVSTWGIKTAASFATYITNRNSLCDTET